MRLRDKRSWLLVCVVTLSLCSFATAAYAISWGELDTDNVYENVGMIQIRDVNTDEVTNFCSGVLIHPRVFLTAAHCIFYFDGDLNSIDFVTTVNFDPDPLAHPDWGNVVSEVRTHPDSNPRLPDLANPDSAVLIFARAVEGIEPATLPEVGYLDRLKADGRLRDGNDGANFTIVGTGSTLGWPPPSIDFDWKRRSATADYLALRNTFLIQSQHRIHGDGGACWFDSGGPSFFTDPDDGETYVVGTTSTGDASCVSTNISYRTDSEEAKSFIDSVIAGLE